MIDDIVTSFSGTTAIRKTNMPGWNAIRYKRIQTFAAYRQEEVINFIKNLGCRAVKTVWR